MKEQRVCPKCYQVTLIIEEAKYAEENSCSNCGYFMPKYYECCNKQELKEVLYINSNDTMAIRNQCINCGKRVGNVPLRRISQKDREELPLFSKKLEEIRQVEFNEVNNYYNTLIETNYWRAYGELYLKFLASEKWAKIRKAVLERDNYKCKCGALATEVHHLTYVRLQNELLEDLVSICRICHLKEHL